MNPATAWLDRLPPVVRAWAPSAALLALAVVAYLPALEAGFVWDDDDYVTQNQTLRSLGGLGRIWFELGAVPQYYPLVHTTFWLEYQAWGLEPAGYHLVNVLLHAAGAVLLFPVLRRLEVSWAWFAAAVFALHPVHVESVAWVTERKNVLSGVCYFGAALAYLRFAERDAAGAGKGSRRHYALFLVLFAGALLSKTVTVSLPAALLLVAWWKRQRVTKADILPLLPAVALAVPLALITVWMEKHHVGARGVDWDFSVVDRCLIAGRALCFYASKLVWPHDLTFVYPRWAIDAGAAWQYLFPLAVIVVLGVLWLRRRPWGVGPLVAVLFFAGTLSPALGFFDVYPMRYSFVADHFQYLGSVGLIALLAGAWARLAGGWLGVAAAGALLAVLAVLTWQQCGSYRDLETLWRDTIRRNPSARMAYTNLGQLLSERGEFDEAMQLFGHAERLDPEDAMVHFNKGVALAARGLTTKAVESYQVALRLDPGDVEVRINLGKLLVDQGDVDAGLEHYRQGLRVDAEHPVLHFNMGVAFERQAQLGEAARLGDAVRSYREAVSLQPSYAAAHNNLGGVLMRLGDRNEAVGHFRSAADHAPGSPSIRLNLANALLAVGSWGEAAAAYRAVIELDDENADAHFNLAVVLLEHGKRAEALPYLREAVRLDPSRAAAAQRLERGDSRGR